jgi:CBS domain-containing protein
MSDPAECGRSRNAGRTRSAADVLSGPARTVNATENLWTAWQLTYAQGVRHLVAVEDARCVGVLDERRIVLSWPLDPLGHKHLSVGDVIRRDLPTVVAGTPVPRLAQLMVELGVDALPVVDDVGVVLGLVTAANLLSVLAENEEDGS